VNTDIQSTAVELRALSLRALKRMYRPEEKMFAFRLRKNALGTVTEGISPRYTAIVLIALSLESEEDKSAVLHGDRIGDVCNRLIDHALLSKELGQVALTLWAARISGHPRASSVLKHLHSFNLKQHSYPTVEAAWSLSALSVEGSEVTDLRLATKLADRLLRSFRNNSGFFPHGLNGTHQSGIRGHVTCFADWVYPVQALSQYYIVTGDTSALAIAKLSAEHMLKLQGLHGQWWWHYDLRTGNVIEPYPVYSVHQDSMAPMAFFALQEADGTISRKAIHKSIDWLIHPPEVENSLIDKQADLIWRKVARHEPGKLVRSLQAGISRIHPNWRVPGVDHVFRPRYVDYECRPYHLGWILYTWSEQRIANMKN